MHKVVKPFPYSVDGFTLIDLAIGDERDFGAMASGLVAEGFIEPAGKGSWVDEPVVETKPEPVEEIEMAVDQPRRGKRK